MYLQVRVSAAAAAFVARELLPCLLCPSNYALSKLSLADGVGGWVGWLVGAWWDAWTERRLH